MINDIEIMSPAGNFESLMAAIQGGADSVYFGVGNLNMRSHSANNFTIDSLKEIVSICKSANVKTYLTLNIVFYDSDLEDLKKTIDAAKEAGVSAVIASDIAAIMYAREVGVEVHISTQLNVSNIESVKFFSQYADVIVLARELTLFQVKSIYSQIEKEQIKGPSGNLVRLELFCHGALCMAISGKCYLSLHEYNASANRGSCYQICRRGYSVTDMETGQSLEIDNKYIMSPKDLATVEFLDVILDSGVKVLKIEGRARAPEYVKTVTSVYKKGVKAFVEGRFNKEVAFELKEELSTVFNRGFWDGYYMGAKLGEWSDVYGNKATRTKRYVGKVTNYFSNIGVAEIFVESGKISLSDSLLIIGSSTGVVEFIVDEIRVDLISVDVAQKGVYCSIAIPKGERVRRQDKVYLWETKEL